MLWAVRNLTLFLLAAACLSWAAERKVLFPKDARPIGPYSPAIQAGEAVYVSGQGGRDHRTGKQAPEFAGQARQTIENIRMILQSGGMDLRNLAYCQIYLDDFRNYDTLLQVYGEYFQQDPPARAILGVAAMPGGAPVEITCVAAARRSLKRAVWPKPMPNRIVPPHAAGMLVGETLYVSGQGPGSTGEDIETQTRTALENMGSVLKAAGMGYENLVFVNPYLTSRQGSDLFNKVYASFFEFGNTPARATIYVRDLPGGARVNFTGVAIRDLKKRRAVRPSNMQPSATASPCVFGGETLYCSAKSGFVPGDGIQAQDVEAQLKQTMRNLLDGLEEAGLGWKDVVATNVYLDDIADFEKMNAVYRTYFPDSPPARTTLQQVDSLGPGRGEGRPGRYPALEQISLIAVRQR